MTQFNNIYVPNLCLHYCWSLINSILLVAICMGFGYWHLSINILYIANYTSNILIGIQ